MSDWVKVPVVLVTRHAAQRLRAEHPTATVLDFSETELLGLAGGDELLCNQGPWEATTGENEEVRATVEKVQRRRGLIP